MPELSAAAALFASDTVERPSCGECARLAEEGLEPPSLSSHSTGLTFTEYSTPVIVAGPLVTAGVTTRVLRELCERVDAFAKKHGEC